MSIYAITVELPTGVSSATILSIVSNTNYCAVYLDENNQPVISDFPFWFFMEFNDETYTVPALSQIIADTTFAFSRYVCYLPKQSLTLDLPYSVDIAFNPFMPSELVNQVKQLLGVV